MTKILGSVSGLQNLKTVRQNFGDAPRPRRLANPWWMRCIALMVMWVMVTAPLLSAVQSVGAAAEVVRPTDSVSAPAPVASVAAGPVYGPATYVQSVLDAVLTAAQNSQPRAAADLPTTLTDAAGRYRFVGLPHGSHRLTLDLASLSDGWGLMANTVSPVLWVTPGATQTSDALPNGVRFTAVYDRTSGDIYGVVFADKNGNGRQDAGEPGLPNVRVIDPTAHQYFVPFNDTNLWDLLDAKLVCHSGSHISGYLDSSIVLVSSYEGTIYYYDHWEDGYDVDPLYPDILSTEVGTLGTGAVKVFQSDITEAGVGGGPPYLYDGRDRITVYGERATLVRMVYPSNPGPVLASAWEIAEVADWGEDYVAVMGEDLDFRVGDGDDANFTGLEVMAAVDDTQVYYNGAYVVTLDTGDTYFINGVGQGGAGGVDSTDTITATQPVQVQMLVGGCAGANSGNGHSLLPINKWSNEYWSPVPGFADSGAGATGACQLSGDSDYDSDIYLHNPNDAAITVNASSNLATVALSIPAHTTRSLLERYGALGYADISNGTSGIHLWSDDVFWGVGVADSSSGENGDSQTYDWSFSLVPDVDLSSQAVVGYAPGTSDAIPDESGNLAFVTAITDTTIYVDLDGNKTADRVDLNGDGDSSDLDVFGVAAWDEPLTALGIPVAAGQTVRIADPIDRNLQGALIYTLDYQHKLAVAWGQDLCTAGTGNPYLDLGYTVFPLPVPTLSKSDDLAIDADLTGDVSPGDTVTYTIILNNNGLGSMNDVVLTDTLPYTYANFVVGSLYISTPPITDAVEYYDGALWGNTPLADAESFRILWPTIGPEQQVTITFQVELLTDIPITITEITNLAVVDSPKTDPKYSEDPDDPLDPDTDTPIGRAMLTLEKQASSALVEPGDTITYSLTITNIGTGIALELDIQDMLPSGLTYVPGTLSMTWPIAVLGVLTRTVTDTAFFYGYYADDFDTSNSAATTGYTGNDGSLSWDTDWVEFADDGNSTTGAATVGATPANALSVPSYLQLTNTNDANVAGASRDADLSQFVSPLLRYYVRGITNSTDETYRISINTTQLVSERLNDAYTLREYSLSAYAGSSIQMDIQAAATLENTDFYRFDQVTIYETTPERYTTSERTWQKSVLSYTTSSGFAPVSYNAATGELVITDSMRLPAEGIVRITYQALVSPTATPGAWLTNTAVITADNWLLITHPSTATESVRVAGADLELDLQASTLTPEVGEVITFTVTITNTGPDATSGVTASFLLPSGYTYGGIVSGSGYNPTTGVWTIGSIGDDGSVTLVFTATVNATGSYPVYAEVGASNVGDPDSTPNDHSTTEDDDDTVNVGPSGITDLAVVKTVTDLTPAVGDVITFTVVVTNHGPSAATGVVVNDLLLGGYTYQGHTASAGTYTQGTGVWSVGNLAADASATLQIRVQVNASGPYANTATVAGNEDDPTPGNDSDTETPVPTPVTDLAVAKSVNDSTPAVGDVITFTVVVTNHGPSAATGVVVNDLLLGGYTYQGHTASAGTYTQGTGVWSVGGLAADASATLRIRVQVNASGPYANTATVAGNEDDPTPGNDSDTETPVPTPVADLAVAKSVNDSTPVVGDVITFTVVVTNHGPSAATGVIVNDLLPSGYTYQGHTASAGTYTQGTGVWSVGGLAADASATLRIRVQVNASGPYANTATVDGNEDDPTPGNDSDTETPVPLGMGQVTGVVYTDVNGDGTYTPGVDTPLMGVDVVITDSLGVMQTVTTGANGMYTATVQAGSATVDVDDTDLPPGSTLTTGSTDPTTVTVQAGGSVSDNTGYRFPDHDGDGVPDYLDPDDDNDGILDTDECPTPSACPDTDRDGIPDIFDLDSDNDGITDVIEGGGDDDDGDGIIDGFEDVDGDGLADSVDPDQGGTPLPVPDTDGDNIPDYLDLDSDNDGIPDVTEAGGDDANGDGIIDNFEDVNGDGLSDNVDPDQGGTPLPVPDTDSDNIPDYLDLDSDNDGIPDVVEAGGTDENGDGIIDNFEDVDGDGLSDNVDPDQGGTPLPIPNTDGEGNPDYLDIDADNDGIPDNIETQPTVGYIPPSGVDADGDGLDDAYDPDQGGTPLPIPDTDDDDTPDYLDLDSDDDGVSDQDESDRGEPTGEDTDGDGLDDGFDDHIGGWVPDDGIGDPADDPQLPDSDGDVNDGGDVDYRDASMCNTPADGYEPDNFFTEAESIPVDGTVYTRTLHVIGDKDWIKFYAWAGKPYTITTLNLNADVDTEVQLYALDGRTLVVENDDYQTDSKASRIVWIAPESGWYYVRVTHFDHTYNPRMSQVCGNGYQIMVMEGPCGVDADPYESDDFYNRSVWVPADGSLLERSFSTVGDKDWIQFDAVKGRVYTLTTSHLGAAIDTVLQLYDVDGKTLIDENDDYLPNSEASRIVWQAPANGVYFARIVHFDHTYDPVTAPVCGNRYMVSVETPLCVLPDAYEPDEYFTIAPQVKSAGQIFTRTFNKPGDKDWISFAARAGQVYTITTFNLSADVDTVIQLYDVDGASLLFENDDYLLDSKASRILWVAPHSGWYYVRVTHFDHTYDPRYALVCGSSYSLQIAQEALGVNKYIRNQADAYVTGDVIDYTIVVWNKLNEVQTGIVITDYIPLYTTYVTGSLRTTQGSISGPDPLVIDVGPLPAGGYVTVTFQVTIQPNAAGAIANRAIVGSDQQGVMMDTPIAIARMLKYLYLPIMIRVVR